MKRLSSLVQSRWDEILVTGVYLQSLIAVIFTLNPWAIALVGLGGLALLAALFWMIGTFEKRRLRPRRGENVAFQIPRRGIAFTVGNQAFTLRFALENQQPDFVGFICTAQSERVADALIAEFALTDDRVKKEMVDPWSIREVREKTRFVLEWLKGKNLALSDMVVDVTGGLTSMSVGAFSVAEEWQVDSQYVRSEYEDNKPKPGTQEAILIGRFSQVGGI